MTLCNLSTHTDCKAALVSLHGLPPLIEMLDGESDLVKRYAAMTLCNLSTLAMNQVRQRPRANTVASAIGRRQWQYSFVHSSSRHYIEHLGSNFKGGGLSLSLLTFLTDECDFRAAISQGLRCTSSVRKMRA